MSVFGIGEYAPPSMLIDNESSVVPIRFGMMSGSVAWIFYLVARSAGAIRNHLQRPAELGRGAAAAAGAGGDRMHDRAFGSQSSNRRVEGGHAPAIVRADAVGDEHHDVIAVGAGLDDRQRGLETPRAIRVDADDLVCELPDSAVAPQL